MLNPKVRYCGELDFSKQRNTLVLYTAMPTYMLLPAAVSFSEFKT